MRKTAYCLFDTAFGSCGIAWSALCDSGVQPAVAFLQLPEATPRRTESRIARNCGVSQPSDPPACIAELIQRISNHFRGDVQDFRDVAVDLGGVGRFARRVFEAARAIAAGETRTYGEVARSCNRPRAARAVGQALGKNPIALIIPCHRVVAAGNKLGGFSAHGRLTTKTRMLAIEGATLGSSDSRVGVRVDPRCDGAV